MQTTRFRAELRALVSTTVVALTALLLPGTAAHAFDDSGAIPELIELTAADMNTPGGVALAQAQDAYRASLGGDPERTLRAASDVVARSSQHFGNSHVYYALALTNLAIQQLAMDDYAASTANFEAAVLAHERAEPSALSERLVNPLHGLASAYMGAGQIEDAIAAYERAVHFTHVNEGPNNLAQVDLVNALSEAYFALGDFREANRIHDRIFLLQKRKLGGDEQMLDALEARARWAKRVKDVDTASKSYQDMVAIIAAEGGENDPRLIDPLIDFAYVSVLRDTGRFARRRANLNQEALRATRRAVRVAGNNVDKDPALLARTLVRQADWMLFMNMRKSARASYREAWSLLTANPALLAVRDELFAEPEAIYRATMDRVYDQPEVDAFDLRTYPGEGYVELRYNVSKKGTAVDIEITDSKPAGLLDVHVYRTLEDFVFRPVHRDGVPAKHEGLTYRHEFRYDPSQFSDRERAFIKRITGEREAMTAAAAPGG